MNKSKLPKPLAHEADLLSQMGVRILGDNEKDDRFVDVILPDGWGVIQLPTSHDGMLVDHKKRTRAWLYCTSSLVALDICFRYRIENIGKGHVQFAVIDRDGERNLFQTEAIQGLAEDEIDLDVMFQQRTRFEIASWRLRQKAVAWLYSHFPNFRNQLAYWE